MIKKTVKYSFYFLFFLLLLIVAVGYYLLNTESGLRQSIALANRYSGYQISVGEIHGKLWQKTELKNLSINGNGIDVASGLVVLDWKPKELWDYRMEVSSIALSDAVVSFAPSKIDKPPRPGKPKKLSLPDIDLPIEIDIENISVKNLTINSPVTKTPVFVVDSFDLGIDYTKQRGEIHTFLFKGEGIDLNMSGHVVTKGNYPLSLKNQASYSSKAYGSQIVDATIDGDLKKNLAVNIKGEGLSDFSLQGSLVSLLDNPNFQAELTLESFNAQQLNLPDTSANAKVSLQGSYQNETAILLMATKGDITYRSPETDDIHINFDAVLDEKNLTLSEFNVDLLTAKQTLVAKGVYGLLEKTLDFKINSPSLSWPQSESTPALVAKDFSAMISGKVSDYKININTLADTLAAGEVPLEIAATGSEQQLDNLHIQALVNHQPITVGGKMVWQPQLDYDLSLAAQDIKPFKDFPGFKNFLMKISGDEKHYQANGGGHVYSEKIPPSDVDLAVKGTPKSLDQALLKINILGGNATVLASGDLQPLNLAANLTLSDIKPQKFYKGINANIQSQIQTQISQVNEKLLAVTEIKSLSGNFQRQPLSGSGKIIYDETNEVLDVQALSLNLAGNKLDSNGLLSMSAEQGESDLKIAIDAQKLSQLMPDLAGALKADIVAKGQLNKPELTATISAKQLKYQQQKIAKLAADIDVNLAQDKLLVNADMKNIKLGSNIINSAKISTQGKLSQHIINVDVRSPKKSNLPSLILVAKGGLNQEGMRWKGSINNLSIDSGITGKWVTSAVTPLMLSAKEISVQKLCLRQQSAALCTNGKIVNQNGKFNVDLRNLSTKRFAALLPKTVAVNTVLNADVLIDLVNGKPDIKGEFNAKGGKLHLATGSGQLTSKIKQFQAVFALKNNRAESVVSADLSKLGSIKIAANIPNISQKALRANIKLDNDNLQFLEELVPQLSHVKGRLNGDMTVSGDPAKQLKIAGKVTLQKTQFNVPKFGTQIHDLTLDVFAKNGNSLGFKGGAKAGKGLFTINGDLNPASQKGLINIKGKNFQIANSKKLQVAISPDLQIFFSDNIKIRGEVLVPKALIVPESSGSKIVASDDVVLPKSKTKKKSVSSPIDAEIRVKLGSDVRVASADIETKLNGAIKVIAKPNKVPVGRGVISIQSGELRVYGQLLNIERGRVIFSGPLVNPSLDIRTSRAVGDVVVGATVLGTAESPEVSLFSTPGMSDSSILSYLLFGRPPNSKSFSSTALLQVGGLVGANTLARGIRTSIGLDVLDFSLTGMEAGKNLSKKLYVGMRSDFFAAINEFLVNYKFSTSLHLEGKYSAGSASTDLIKIIETD